jgi:hypothetical protein
MPGAEDMGARVFYEMSAKLKRAGAGDLRKQLHKEVREAAKPLLPAVRRQAAARFPTRGGLNKHMAKGSRYRTVAKTGLSTAGVSIRANRTDPRVDRRGRVQHPIFGRKPDKSRRKELAAAGKTDTAVQMVPNAVGFFSETIEERAHYVKKDLLDALERWADEFLR